MEAIVPVILSGGSGTRLWPMSTAERPKQFLALSGPGTMFRQTLERVGTAAGFAAPIIVANARHADLIDAGLAEAGCEEASIILEPCARNTAPAIALAAAEAGSAPLLVMPSDHVIADVSAFHRAIRAALPLVRQGWLATFGIEPDGPETGYGYIRTGAELADGIYRVDRFVEKPDRETAMQMLAQGGHFWNGGIFLFRADAYLEALARFAPDCARASQAAMQAATRDGRRISPGREAFEASPSESIDYAVMEKAARVAVVPVAMGWSDVGSWDSLHAIAARDADGNDIQGAVRADGVRNSLVRSDGVRISIAGVEDLIVIASGNEVMILPRGRSQEARKFAGS